MGRLHARIYSEMENVNLVAVVDTQLDKAQALTNEFGGSPHSSYTDIIDHVDAVTIAVPTESHAAVAQPFLERRIGILVEKPLAATLPEARRMLESARTGKCTLQVGYSERFNPIVQAMHRLNIIPHFMDAQRVSPYSFRSTDVGVVLDIMIHDIDIVLSLVESPVVDVHAVGVSVLGRHEDVANVRLTFESGCVANLTASRLALKTERKIRIFSEQAYLSLDYLKKSGVMISKTANIDTLKKLRDNHHDAQIDIANLDWTDLVNVDMLDIDDREPLRLEQEAFIKAVSDGSRPQVSAEDAVAAMELAERIVKVIAQHRWAGRDAATISSDLLTDLPQPQPTTTARSTRTAK